MNTKMHKKAQLWFRYRLFLLRQRQILVAKKLAENADYEWRVYLSECKEWKKTCTAITCEGCGYKLTECRCAHRAKLEDLVVMLRRLAGINPVHGVTSYLHDEDKSSGPAGYQVCGKNNWDNAVRALDENR